MPLATNRPRPTVRGPLHNHVPAARPAPSLKIRQRVLDVPYEMRGVAQAAGAEWNAVAKAHVYRGAGELPESLVPFEAQKYSWEALKEDELNGVVDLVPAPAQKVITLKDHQVEATAVIAAAQKAGRPGFLLADDVGLGKTFTAVKALLDMADAETILIVCPLSVVAHWRRVIRWMGDRGKRFVVINYDRLKKLFDVPAQIAAAQAKRKSKRKVRKVRTQKGIARFGEAYHFDTVLFDESHKLRNLETARSKLAMKLTAPADFVLWLSATAGQDPLELAYLAPLLADVTGAEVSDLKEFEKWCQDQGVGVTRGAYGKWMWRGRSDNDLERAQAEADLELFRSLLFDGDVPAGIRRTPHDIAGWPEINRVLLPVDLDPADRALYMKAWDEFRAALDLEGGKRGSGTQNGLVARLRFRQKASLLRTAATADLAEELLGQGLQVTISVGFHETMDVLKAGLEAVGYSVATIHGRMSGAERERNRLDFQQGRAQVCIFTVEDGISLQANEDELTTSTQRASIIHDLRWSAIQQIQIEGRAHRNGESSVAYWMMGAGTVEEDIAEVVAGRILSMSTMQGDQNTVDAIDDLLVQVAASRRPALLAA